MTGERIYLDNAATSFPKPAAVYEAMARYARELGCPARGGYGEVHEAARLVQRCRERLTELCGAWEPGHCVFTLNTSDALNMAIHGLVQHRLRTRPGEAIHLVTTDADHNSILRPLNHLCDAHRGQITQTRVGVDPMTGAIDPDDVRRAITPRTLLVATLHSSNVTGVIQPVASIGAICRDAGVVFVLDAAQSLGHVPLDMRSMNIDLCAFAGHKGLLGPTGTGGLVIRPGLEKVLDPYRQGGTGNQSELEHQPEFLPDKYEPGSHNTMGIVGLSEGVAWLLARGAQALRRHELELIEIALEALAGPDAPAGLRLIGPRDPMFRTGVFTFTHETIDSRTLGRLLEERGILSRSGLHCAPAMHASVGTRGEGATRLSFGPFTTHEHVRLAMRAVKRICEGAPTPKMSESSSES